MALPNCEDPLPLTIVLCSPAVAESYSERGVLGGRCPALVGGSQRGNRTRLSQTLQCRDTTLLSQAVFFFARRQFIVGAPDKNGAATFRLKNREICRNSRGGRKTSSSTGGWNQRGPYFHRSLQNCNAVYPICNSGRFGTPSFTLPGCYLNRADHHGVPSGLCLWPPPPTDSVG